MSKNDLPEIPEQDQESLAEDMAKLDKGVIPEQGEWVPVNLNDPTRREKMWLGLIGYAIEQSKKGGPNGRTGFF